MSYRYCGQLAVGPGHERGVSELLAVDEAVAVRVHALEAAARLRLPVLPRACVSEAGAATSTFVKESSGGSIYSATRLRYSSDHVSLAAAAPTIPIVVISPGPPGMRSIHPQAWHREWRASGYDRMGNCCCVGGRP